MWERKIGSVRKVFESAFLELKNCRKLARDEFTTLLAEEAAIVNNTQLWTTSDDVANPIPLSPVMLQTLHSVPNPAHIY